MRHYTRPQFAAESNPPPTPAATNEPIDPIQMYEQQIAEYDKVIAGGRAEKAAAGNIHDQAVLDAEATNDAIASHALKVSIRALETVSDAAATIGYKDAPGIPAVLADKPMKLSPRELRQHVPLAKTHGRRDPNEKHSAYAAKVSFLARTKGRLIRFLGIQDPLILATTYRRPEYARHHPAKTKIGKVAQFLSPLDKHRKHAVRAEHNPARAPLSRADALGLIAYSTRARLDYALSGNEEAYEAALSPERGEIKPLQAWALKEYRSKTGSNKRETEAASPDEILAIEKSLRDEALALRTFIDSKMDNDDKGDLKRDPDLLSTSEKQETAIAIRRLLGATALHSVILSEIPQADSGEEMARLGAMKAKIQTAAFLDPTSPGAQNQTSPGAQNQVHIIIDAEERLAELGQSDTQVAKDTAKHLHKRITNAYKKLGIENKNDLKELVTIQSGDQAALKKYRERQLYVLEELNATIMAMDELAASGVPVSSGAIMLRQPVQKMIAKRVLRIGGDPSEAAAESLMLQDEYTHHIKLRDEATLRLQRASEAKAKALQDRQEAREKLERERGKGKP